MKKLVLILLLSLTGCSSIHDIVEAYLMKYDANEYRLITDIRTFASLNKSNCDNAELSKSNAFIISQQTITFKNYVQYTPHNEKVIAASIDLNNIAQGLNALYLKGPVGPAFCKIKFDTIEKSAELMQKTIGAKPR